MTCFNGGCTGDRAHARLHFESTNHPVALNIKRKRRTRDRDGPPKKITKLAIAAETDEDRYEITKSVKCYADQVDLVEGKGGQIDKVVEDVMHALTFSRKEEVKAWDLETTPCENTLCLQQYPSRQLDQQKLGHCAQCELTENLWLCLECGNLGCGRDQVGGTGGNSHGVAHYSDTQHAVAVKLGSISPEGTADIYCYHCNEERTDPELAAHLKHWGINIAERHKTEKSLTEMQIEQNMRWDFSVVGENGKELEPVYGAGLTGLKNLGNSCYLASVLQCLFSLPEFQKRYLRSEGSTRAASKPAEDLETQLRKVADGLLTGRYSKPDTDIFTSENMPEVSYQKGLAPSMLKVLIGKDHEEFSTMRQQDSFELLLHLLKLINRSPHTVTLPDPVESFRFVLEQRLQCLSCKKVRYRTDKQDNISVHVPARRQASTTESADAHRGAEFEPVTLKECLTIFTSPEKVELTCSACGSKAGFTKRSMFKTFPATLVINARRFEIVNWVPRKLDIPVVVDDASFSMDEYKSSGKQQDEEELPEESAPVTSAPAFQANQTALQQLESMGFPFNRCKKALHATGNGADPEPAMQWLFAHLEDADIDEPLVEASVGPNTGGATAGAVAVDPEMIETLGEMGFRAPQARKALKQTGGDAERAVEWLFSHPDDQGEFEGEGEEEPAAQTGSGAVGEDTSKRAAREMPGSEMLPASFKLQSIVCHKGASIHTG